MDDIQESRRGDLKGKKKGEGADVTSGEEEEDKPRAVAEAAYAWSPIP